MQNNVIVVGHLSGNLNKYNSFLPFS